MAKGGVKSEFNLGLTKHTEYKWIVLRERCFFWSDRKRLTCTLSTRECCPMRLVGDYGLHTKII